MQSGELNERALLQIVNEQIREKLRAHNFCRNPNPEKESRPWCFTGSGKREYCDIPACGNIGKYFQVDWSNIFGWVVKNDVNMNIV